MAGFLDDLTALTSTPQWQGAMYGLATGKNWQQSLANMGMGYTQGQLLAKKRAEEQAKKDEEAKKKAQDTRNYQILTSQFLPDIQEMTQLDPVGARAYVDYVGPRDVFSQLGAWRKEKAKGSNRKIVEGADGYKYYQDTGERVLPNVTKDAPKLSGTLQEWRDAIGVGAVPEGTTYPDYLDIKKGNGITFTNPDGITVQIGGRKANAAPGNMPLSNGAMTAIQKDVASGEEMLSTLDRIAKTYDRDALTYKGQAAAWADRVGNKLGISSGETAKKQRAFVQNVESVFNQYRKDITGAAASVKELDRLKSAMINIDLSPAEFEAAYTEFRSALEATITIRKALLSRGIDPNTPQGGKLFDQAFMQQRAQSAAPRLKFNPATGKIE